MGQMNVNPQRVEELMKRLLSITNDMQSKQKQLKVHIQNLEHYWNDHHYKSFTEQYGEFDKILQKALQYSETILIPNLKNIKKFADEYENLGRK